MLRPVIEDHRRGAVRTDPAGLECGDADRTGTLAHDAVLEGEVADGGGDLGLADRDHALDVRSRDVDGDRSGLEVARETVRQRRLDRHRLHPAALEGAEHRRRRRRRRRRRHGRLVGRRR